MSQAQAPKGAFTAKKVRKSIKLDRVSPSDFNNLNMLYCCEQCSFFNPENQDCLMGYRTEPHLREQQLKRYNLTGHMAFCRFQEID